MAGSHHTSTAELVRVNGRMFSSAFSSWAAYAAAMRCDACSPEEAEAGAGAHVTSHQRSTEVSISGTCQNWLLVVRGCMHCTCSGML